MKIAFIGAGNMAREHAKAFREIPGTEFVGVFSPTEASRENFAEDFEVKHSVDSIDELYSKASPDGIVVTVPPDKVSSVLKKTFQYDWFQLVEKPIGLNLVECESIYKDAINLGLDDRIFGALNRRHYASVLELKSIIDSQASGITISITDQENIFEAKNYGHSDSVTDYWEYANSIHLIDLIGFLCRGDLMSISEAPAFDKSQQSVLTRILEFSSGDKCVYMGIWNLAGPWSITAATSTGFVELRPIEKMNLIRPDSRVAELIIEPENDGLKVGLRKQSEEFLKAIRREAFSLPSLEDCLKTQRLINDIYV